MEKLVITSVKGESNIAQITVTGMKDEPGATMRLFHTLSGEGIIVDMILQAPGRDDSVDLMFTVEPDKVSQAVDVLENNKNKLKFEDVAPDRNIAKISLTGAGLMSHSDIVPRVLSCFYAANAPMNSISTSEVAIKVFTNANKKDRVIEKLREEFEDYDL